MQPNMLESNFVQRCNSAADGGTVRPQSQVWEQSVIKKPREVGGGVYPTKVLYCFIVCVCTDYPQAETQAYVCTSTHITTSFCNVW